MLGFSWFLSFLGLAFLVVIANSVHAERDATYGGITKPETRKKICQCLHKLAVRDGYKLDRAKKTLEYCKIDFPVPLAPSAADSWK
ncbi:hypothetical protein DITRI_Ditri19aG0009600 [Diplodiscus trichospermus]